MHVVFHVVGVWVAVDVLFVAAWAALSTRGRRAPVADMVDAAERYADHAGSASTLSRVAP